MVATVEVERWRSYFGKAGADIWTIIRQAINIAAMDHPKDFRERRGEIAETLFARSLLMMHVRDAQDNLKVDMPNMRLTHIVPADDGSATPAHEEGELRESDTRAWHVSRKQSIDVVANDDDDATQVRYHEQAEALSNELEKEACLIRDLDGIKATIMEGDQPESVVLEVLQELQHMQITVGALKTTEIGKHVNCLRKHTSKRVRALVKDLVRQWKVLVDEWVNSARDVAQAAATEATATDHGDGAESCDYEDGLALPPLDEDALLEARAPSLDLSQLLSFSDGEICTGNKDSLKSSISVEPSVKDNLNYLSRSLSGSMLTDSSDFDTKLSTNHPWGHRTPEERGSATRDMYPPSGKFEKTESALKEQMVQKAPKGSGLPVSKETAYGSGPGRPCSEALKGKLALGGKPTSDCNGLSRSHVVHKTTTANASSGEKLPNLKSDKTHDQKLEIAKRKLHQGYQQAENAKKQRTVQVLSFPDLPKAAHTVKGKSNQSVQSKVAPVSQSRAGFQSGHGSQNRRFT